MRLGKVKLNLEYVFDLDDENMVDHAKDALLDAMKDKIIAKVIEQIKQDTEAGDHTAISELLENCPLAKLVNFLPEEKLLEVSPVIEVQLLYCIEGNEVSFDKELMISDFITEMNGVIAEFCKQNNLIEQ